jgi:hypothetical protein
MSFFETKLTWHVYDGTYTPNEGRYFVLLNESSSVNICKFELGKWNRDGLILASLRYGDIWASIPERTHFPKIKLNVSVEIE